MKSAGYTKPQFIAHAAAVDICNRFATHYVDVHCQAGPWGTKHLDDVTKIVEGCVADALRYAADKCRELYSDEGWNGLCKNTAMNCAGHLEAEADELEKP